MPFTLCHPALVLPLNAGAGRYTSLAALVIGSMTPDFVYFLPLGANGALSHSWIGILVHCLPAGLVAYILYHALLREAFIAWAPEAISSRMKTEVPWIPRNVRAAAIVLASLALGAASHLVWDAFTHANTAPVARFDLLRSTIAIGNRDLPLYKLLQHLSSLAGLLVIVLYVARWFARTAPGLPPGSALTARQKLGVLAAVAAAGCAGALAGLVFRHARSAEHSLFNAVVSGMAAAVLAIMLLSIIRKASTGWR